VFGGGALKERQCLFDLTFLEQASPSRKMKVRLPLGSPESANEEKKEKGFHQWLE